VSKQQIYLWIVRDDAGEKLAEQVAARVPDIGEIIALSYLDTHGRFEVLEVTLKATMPDFQVVLLKVKPEQQSHHPADVLFTWGTLTLAILLPSISHWSRTKGRSLSLRAGDSPS
jgi:hypothetical protein